MLSAIEHHSMFKVKPYGPLHKCISEPLKSTLPPAFLHTYVVDNYYDQRQLKDLCLDKGEPVPVVLVTEYATEMYDLESDSEASVNPDMVNLLKKEDPTIANLLIDYFELHKPSKYIRL